MVELVDTLDSDSSVRKDMEVQVLSSALKKTSYTSWSFFYYRYYMGTSENFFAYKFAYHKPFFRGSLMNKLFILLFLSLFWGCAEEPFKECTSISIEDMRDIPAESENARACYTLFGDLTYKYDQNLCQREPCFFFYDLDSKENRLDSFIFLSDSLKSGVFPNWKDTSEHEITRITGYYYPNRIPSTTPLTIESQEAFFVTDIE